MTINLKKNTLAKQSISIFLNIESHLPAFADMTTLELSSSSSKLCHCPLPDVLSSDTVGENKVLIQPILPKPLHLWPYTLPFQLVEMEAVLPASTQVHLSFISPLFSFPITSQEL